MLFFTTVAASVFPMNTCVGKKKKTNFMIAAVTLTVLPFYHVKIVCVNFLYRGKYPLRKKI